MRFIAFWFVYACFWIDEFTREFIAWINPWHWRWNRTTDVYDGHRIHLAH